MFKKDHYYLLNEVFTKNRGADRFKVQLDLPKAAAFFFLASGGNEEQSIQKLRGYL